MKRRELLALLSAENRGRRSAGEVTLILPVSVVDQIIDEIDRPMFDPDGEVGS